jgi:hypothetical protein
MPRLKSKVGQGHGTKNKYRKYKWKKKELKTEIQISPIINLKKIVFYIKGRKMSVSDRKSS